MRFHSLQLRIKGKVVDYLDDNLGREPDIADEFSRFSRSLGLEGAPDTYVGLWSTQPVYNDHSLLRGDFLAKELHLDLLLDTESGIPFREIFLCVGETLRRIVKCELTKVTIVCEPYAVSVKAKKRRSKESSQLLLNLNIEEKLLPIVRCSTLQFTTKNKRNAALLSEELSLGKPQYYLPELSLPFSKVWSYWEDSLHHVEKIQITAR